MTSNARHNEHVRLAPVSDTSQGPHRENTEPVAFQRRRPSGITWVVAASASLTALAVKLCQQWFIHAGETNTFNQLTATFDWAAILLCICAVALVAFQSLPPNHRTQQEDGPKGLTIHAAPTRTNLALPAPDDSRLRLAQSLSHELRTPLNAVIGFSDIMNHQLHGNLGHPKYNEYCAHISASSQTLLRAVDDILALNSDLGMDITNRVPLPVAEALRNAWDKNTTDDAANLEISGDAEPKVIADPDILSHALKNVVDTLSNHAAPGATVSAVIRNEESKTRIYCTARLDPSRMVETAPLANCAGTKQASAARASRDTLAEAAAEALVRSMDGDLIIRQPADTFNLEVICDLPAPRNENRPHSQDANVA